MMSYSTSRWRQAFLLFSNQTFRQSSKFDAGIRAPHHPPVPQHAYNRPTHGTAQRLDTVAVLEIKCFRKLLHNPGHGIVIEHTGDMVGYGRHHFTPATRGELGENEVNYCPANVSEGIAVEEKKRSAAMSLPQEFYGFIEGGDFCLAAAPLCFKRCIAL